ncbi:hypothetical protein GJ496_001755 [Pomphorhynchus laevis]|nr:hypothetical protein GJ496_001755 [Pomphorhynchus laevis]
MWERKELDKLMSKSKIFQNIHKNRKFKSQNVNSSGWYRNYIRLIANGCFPHAMRLLYNNGAQNVIHKVDDEICPGTSVRDELIRLHPESKGIEPSSVISQKVKRKNIKHREGIETNVGIERRTEINNKIYKGKRCITMATAYPSSSLNRRLSALEFRDALCVRYGLQAQGCPKNLYVMKTIPQPTHSYVNMEVQVFYDTTISEMC